MGNLRTRLVALVTVLVMTAGCAGPVGEGAKRGALLGGLLGAGAGGAAGGGKGAAIGGAAGLLLGGIAGAAIGAAEAKNILTEPQPLPWLIGKKISVVPHPRDYYGFDIGGPVVEDQLRRRGAEIYSYSSYAAPGQAPPVDYVVEVRALDKGAGVILELRVVEPGARIAAYAEHVVWYQRYSYYSGDYRVDAIRNAARAAVWKLH